MSKKLASTTASKSNVKSQETISNYFCNSISRKRPVTESENDKANVLDAVPAKTLKSADNEKCNIVKNILSDSTKERIKSFSYSTSITEDCNNDEEEIHVSSHTFKEIQHDVESGKVKASNEKRDSNGVMLTKEDNIKYTPLEEQYFEFKKKYPHVVLLIECGYKYRFFAEDAEIASKELNIASYKTRNLLSAIIPTHRLHIHVQRLVSKNYKVGVVKQTESAALKAIGDNKNSLFSRKLHAIYTKSTLIGNEFSASDISCEESVCIDSGYLVCIYEELQKDSKTSPSNIAVLAIQPMSGDMVYSSFQDALHKKQLEGVLLRIDPAEIIYPESGLSCETERLLNFASTHGLKQIRLEQIPTEIFNYAFAINKVTSFYESNDREEQEQSNVLQTVLSLPPPVVCCLSALIIYLSDLKLERILKNLSYLKPLCESGENLALNAAAVKSLELFANASTYSEHGSLLWVLKKTLTRFGERLLRLWISRPFKIKEKIEARLNVVTEILQSESLVFNILEKSLTKLPDLEKMLCSAFYHRCSCSEYLSLIHCFKQLKNELHDMSHMIKVEVTASKLKELFSEIIFLLSDVESFNHNINEKAARDEDKQNIFLDTKMFPAVESCKKQIKFIEEKLNGLKVSICKTLRLPAFKYRTVSGQKYLIEIPNSLVSLVPSNWTKISGTKQFARFRSPEVAKFRYELEQQEAILTETCDMAWHSFLDEFGKCFYKYKRAVSHLAELDCYLCFAKVAKEEHYCRPVILDDSLQMLNIQQGRNPIVTKLMGEQVQFVANDTKLNNMERCMIITGPNMGGKSTYIRQVALLVLMAHMGCYVPADSAIIPLFDGIYVRMGADDDLDYNRSTFMNEMSETSDILSSATSKSLIILDELGRGTSTHDGSLVAYATLEYLISEVKCLVLFVTHYPQVVDLHSKFPENITTTQMAFVIEDSDNNGEIESLTFLYNLIAGVSKKSYGINVARLAQIPKNLLLKAQKKSLDFAQQIRGKRRMSSILKKLSLRKNIGQLQNLTIPMES